MTTSRLFVFSFLFFGSLLAQTNTPQLTSSDYNIADIVQDKYGFIWMSTERGIIRYDGTHSLLQKNSGLRNSAFGNFYGNVEQDNIEVSNSFEKSTLRISKRQTKTITVKSEDYKIQRINGRRALHFIKNNMPASYYSDVTDYFIKIKNETYLFSNKTIYYKATKNAAFKNLNIKSGNSDLSRVFMLDDTLFYTDVTQNKLICLKQGEIVSSVQFPSLLLDPKLEVYWHQTTGQSFAILDNKLYLLHYENNALTLEFLLRHIEIHKKSFGSIFYDHKAKKVFLGGAVNGLSILKLPEFSVSKKELSSLDEIYYTALPYDPQSIITEEGWTYNKTGAKKVFDNPRIPDRFYLAYDSLGNMVYKDYYHIIKRYKNQQYKHPENVANFKEVIEGVFKTNGLFVVSVPHAGKRELSVYTDDSFRNVKCKISVPDFVFSVFRYTDDLLYISCNSGLYLASISKGEIIKTVIEGFAVKHIIKSKDGNLWFTTFDQGPYFLKNNKAIKLPLDPEKGMQTAHYFLEDSKGYFWFSSNNGIFKVKKTELLDYVTGKRNEVIYYHYTKEDGFLNNEFNGSSNPCATKLPNGEFVFPSMDGFVFFAPEKINSYYPNQLFIDRLNVDNKVIYIEDKIRIRSDFKKAEIYLDLPYYSNFSNIYLQTKIEGEKGDWQFINESRTLPIVERKPGDYVYLVRFVNAKDGRFTYKKLQVEITPMYYQTLWFQLLMLVLLGIFIMILIRMRTTYLRKRHKVLKANIEVQNARLLTKRRKIQRAEKQLEEESDFHQQLMESISHDISSPVKFIALLSDKMNSEKDESLQKEYLRSVFSSAEQLYHFTKELRNYADLFKQCRTDTSVFCNIYELLETKKKLFEEISAQKGIKISNNCSKNLNFTIDKNVFLVIIHNLIDNAIKYSDHGKIKLEAMKSNNELLVRISDIGLGMTPEQKEYFTMLSSKITTKENISLKDYGLGLHLVISLLKKIQASIYFKENHPQGTTIELLFKNEIHD